MLRAIGGLQQPMLALAEAGFSRFKPALKPEIPAQRFDPIPATSASEIDRVILALHDHAQAWADTGPAERASLLRKCITSTLEVRTYCIRWLYSSSFCVALESVGPPPPAS